MIFHSRNHAADLLIERLEGEGCVHPETIFMAVPRGAVPMTVRMARHFGCRMGIVLVKKISHPHNKEYALGAVGLSAEVFDEDANRLTGEERSRAVDEARTLLRKRYDRFFGSIPPIRVTGAPVIIVDDGIATGATLEAAVKVLRTEQPSDIIIAAPVASRESVQRLEQVADRVIVLHTPDPFIAVGRFFEHFEEVTDDDVVATLRAARRPDA
ncbi:MAG: phosphoribosyltransferase [Candidatus Kapaibacterium sp.]